MPFGLIWFSAKPKQMPFGNWTAMPKQIGPNETITFGTEPKQMALVYWPARPNKISSIGTKQKLYVFGN